MKELSIFIYVEKKHIEDEVELTAKLSKQIASQAIAKKLLKTGCKISIQNNPLV